MCGYTYNKVQLILIGDKRVTSNDLRLFNKLLKRLGVPHNIDEQELMLNRNQKSILAGDARDSLVRKRKAVIKRNKEILGDMFDILRESGSTIEEVSNKFGIGRSLTYSILSGYRPVSKETYDKVRRSLISKGYKF